MTQTRLAPSLAKRFRSGRPCLDFVHTGDSPDWLEPELIHGPADLERWLGHILGSTRVRAENGDVDTARRLREALRTLARARTDGRPFAAADVRIVNEFAAQAPPVPRLTTDGAAEPLTTTATAALSAIARDAVELFSGPLGHRVRVCAAEGCAYLFVDASRPGTRRWCSMERCGNLAKVRTHREGRAGADA